MSLHRLLLVEDDADMAAMLAAYLQRHGLHVTRADSRATALAALRGGRVDLILLDVSLGDDDGVAICAEIRAASLSHRKRDSGLRFAGWRYDARRDEVTAPGGWQVSLSSRRAS